MLYLISTVQKKIDCTCLFIINLFFIGKYIKGNRIIQNVNLRNFNSGGSLSVLNAGKEDLICRQSVGPGCWSSKLILIHSNPLFFATSYIASAVSQSSGVSMSCTRQRGRMAGNASPVYIFFVLRNFLLSSQ